MNNDSLMGTPFSQNTFPGFTYEKEQTMKQNSQMMNEDHNGMDVEND